ncbi:sigma-54-dependent Fis family transcriptional regulator [Paraburkholderia sacchari]|uniref:Sigma-54-dependent Fis family transcriptional regulator n=1 Tax=Paraburkholderia sacchari TaxID=159450 RepID=A0A8T6ZDC5_9BURK|nr:sigma-54-dependent Fis family transcriptional regulator [Paraburkholderia sacchari]NLP62776.1 sigma-54-dependent Fis family transcriptional regulator [Paraburkholderia sacchari]
MQSTQYAEECIERPARASGVDGVLRQRLGHYEPGAAIVRSWTRCLNDYGLDPDACRPPPVLTSAELAQRRERLADLIGCAKLEMTTLYQQLGDADLAVVLSDADGVILHLVSSASFAEQVEDWGFCVGAVWNEREAGTNGMGTCLAEGEALAVRQHEHFFSRYAALTCSAAPVFDERGALAGVLDVTSRSQLQQQHSLVLVGMSRQMIENRLLDARHTQAHMVHFHSRPEFVNTLHAGKLTIDESGLVLGANRSALFQLGFGTLAEIAGKRITDLFNATLADLVARSVQSSFHPVALYRAHAPNRFFAVAQAPLKQTAANIGRTTAQPVAAQDSQKPHESEAAVPRRAPARHPGRASCGPRVEFGDAHLASQLRLGERVIDRGIAVLVRGETGSGKDVFANALHAASARRDGPFVAINCASLPEHLIESELFGYRAGAFTGAQREGRRGKVLQANGGTLFLDEIGDMPLALQARLLRVLEEREVTPLGSESAIKVDFQLISASHRDLAALVASGQFREDLYYRLNGVAVSVPPLRDREDKLELILHLLEQDNEVPPMLGRDARRILLASAWPGNVRQLRNVLRTAAALCEGPELTAAHLPAELVRGASLPAMQRGDASGYASGYAPLATASDCDGNIDQSDDGDEGCEPLNAILQAERDALMGLLDTHRWNVSEVANALGVTRNTLYRKMRRVRIKR